MVVIRNLIGQIGQLRFEAGLLALDEAAADLSQLFCIGQRAVLEYTFTGLKHQIKAIKRAITLLQLVDHTQALEIVLEAAIGFHASIQCILSCVTKGCVPQIVRE